MFWLVRTSYFDIGCMTSATTATHRMLIDLLGYIADHSYYSLCNPKQVTLGFSFYEDFSMAPICRIDQHSDFDFCFKRQDSST